MHVHGLPSPATGRSPFRLPLWLGFLGFLAIAVFFLWSEHRAHILGALPFVLLLLCPALHFFMHGGHGNHQTSGDPENAGHRGEHS
jgi:hypothetical protein